MHVFEYCFLAGTLLPKLQPRSESSIVCRKELHSSESTYHVHIRKLRHTMLSLELNSPSKYPLTVLKMGNSSL